MAMLLHKPHMLNVSDILNKSASVYMQIKIAVRKVLFEKNVFLFIYFNKLYLFLNCKQTLNLPIGYFIHVFIFIYFYVGQSRPVIYIIYYKYST